MMKSVSSANCGCDRLVDVDCDVEMLYISSVGHFDDACQVEVDPDAFSFDRANAEVINVPICPLFPMILPGVPQKLV
jgi:hypothetical protein